MKLQPEPLSGAALDTYLELRSPQYFEMVKQALRFRQRGSLVRARSRLVQ